MTQGPKPATCSIKKLFLKISQIFKGKHLSWSIFFIKLPNWRPVSFLKRDSNSGAFLWILRNFLKKSIPRNICERLLLRVLKPTSCHMSVSIHPENIRKWDLKIFSGCTKRPLAQNGFTRHRIKTKQYLFAFLLIRL